MNVVIDGLGKAEVLLALYNKACFEGPGSRSQTMMQFTYAISPLGNHAEAIAEIAKCSEKKCFYLDSVNLGSGPRPIRVNLGGTEFDPTAFDHEHGEDGYAATIIKELRAPLGQSKGGIAYLLSRMSSLFSTSKEPENSRTVTFKNECTRL